MDDIDIQFGVKFDITKESNDALIACINQSFKAVAWMTAMGTGEKVKPSACAGNEAWHELLKRSNESKKTCIVKTFVTEAMKNKVLTVTPDRISCEGNGKVTELVHLGGFLVPAVLKDKEETKAAVALEVAVECILFAQDSDPTIKRSSATTVDPAKADEFDVPLFPIIAAYGGKSYKASVIETDLRNKEKRSPGIVAKFLATNFPETTPSKTRKVQWLGCSFSPATPYRAPKVLNQNSLFQIICDHRRIRGADSGRRSLYSKGYYHGYMDSPTASAFRLVADLENLCRLTSGQRFLEIQNLDGMFTEIVLLSLIANGWVIRVVNGHGLNSIEVGDDKVVKPGAYRAVTKCTMPFFVYHNLDEKTPTIVKNESSKTYEVNLPKISERLTELKDVAGGRIAFTYVYYRDELAGMIDHLYVSAHAHAGQLIFCSMQVDKKDRIDLHEYAIRTLYANAYKTGFPYYRIPFFGKDKMRFNFPFKLTMKAKIQPSKAWCADDFEIQLLEDKIEIIKIDYESLARRAPIIADRIQVSQGRAPEEKKKKVMEMVIDEDMAQAEISNDNKTFDSGVGDMSSFSFDCPVEGINSDIDNIV